MTSLRLGASTWTYLQSRDLRAALRTLRGLGYEHFDVLTIPPHLWPSDIDAAGRHDLRRWCGDEGVTIESLNLPSTDQNLCSVTPEMREFSIAQWIAVLDLCEALGVSSAVMVPGRRPNFVPAPATQTDGWLRAALDRLLPRAERAGVTLMLENHHQSPMPTVARMAEFLDVVGSDRLGIAYDVANGEFVGEDQGNAIRAAGSWLRQVHLSDASRARWDHAPPGRGSIDFAAVSRALASFEGTSVVELISEKADTDMAEARTYLGAHGWR